MVVTENDLKEKLRRSLGNLTLTQLTDDQADDAVQDAIKEYSKYRPILVFDSLATIGEVATYDLSVKERIIKVKEVFYSGGSGFDEFSSDYSQLGRLEGLSLFENPSLWIQYIQRLEQYKSKFVGDFEYDRSTKVLRLIPLPSESGKKVYYVWLQRHVVTTIPEDDIEIVLLWAKGEAKEMLASKKSYEIRSVSGYGESVSFGATSDSLMKEAQDLKARFEGKFGKFEFLAG